MLELLKGLFTNVDVGTIIARAVFAIVAVLIFFLFFYYAKKRNLHIVIYVSSAVIAVLFITSFFVSASEISFYVYFALGFLCVLGLMLFIQDINRHFFRLSRRRKKLKDIPDHYGREDLSKSAGEIVRACLRLSKTNTGALIIIADNMSDTIVDSGIKLNAEVTGELLETLFFPKTPLHDGAVIITSNKIMSAGCYLPLTQATNLPREFGTRHRAAIGVSTSYPDCTAIVVSEETGIISAMHDGKIKRYLDTQQLQAILDCSLGLADESAEARIWGEDVK